MPRIQEIDRAASDRLAEARQPLIEALSRAAAGRPWHYLLFGSFARGTMRRGSDVDLAILGAGPAWREAERAALRIGDALGLEMQVMLWEDLDETVRAEALRDGIPCGA